jgi:hypothetical protein
MTTRICRSGVIVKAGRFFSHPPAPVERIKRLGHLQSDLTAAQNTREVIAERFVQDSPIPGI